MLNFYVANCADQNCVATTKSLPGVEAQVDDPDKCGKPSCIVPDNSQWDAAGERINNLKCY